MKTILLRVIAGIIACGLMTVVILLGASSANADTPTSDASTPPVVTTTVPPMSDASSNDPLVLVIDDRTYNCYVAGVPDGNTKTVEAVSFRGQTYACIKIADVSDDNADDLFVVVFVIIMACVIVYLVFGLGSSYYY